MMKTIFYVGRSYPHKEPLLQLKNMGYQLGLLRDTSYKVKNADLFDFVIPLDFSSTEKFSESLANTATLPHIDGLLCTYENYIIYKVIAAEFLSLPSLSQESALACTDKFLMREMFQSYDPAISPEYTLVDSRDALVTFANTVGYPLILKPTNLVKSLLVSKCRNEQELLSAYANTLAQINDVYRRLHITSREPRLIVEKFIEGKMCSVAAMVDESGTAHFSEGIASLTTAQNIDFDDNFLYCRKLDSSLSPELQGKILAVAEAGVRALKMTSSPAHIEIIYNETEVKLVEIGARIGGYRPYLYEKSYGVDMIAQEALVAVGSPVSLEGEFRQYSALYELFPKKQGAFQGLKNYINSDDFDYFHQVARAGSDVGRAEDGFKAPVIVGVIDTDLEAFDKKCAAVEKIEVNVS